MYIAYALAAAVLAAVLTALLKPLMRELNIIDPAKAEARKIHKKNIPLGGGLAIFIAFFALAFYALYGADILGKEIVPRYLIGLFLGGLVLMIGGFVDDKYCLKARYQILFPILAAIIVIAFGIGPHAVTNPFSGGFLRLDAWQIHIRGLGTWVVLADIVVFFWLMGLMFTTKLLDGLDGLVTGVVAIGFLIIFLLARTPQWNQPEVALLSLIACGACLGFLMFNWHPASIFLGQGGSLFTGFLLGSLAIISGAKIATTLLVMAIPVLDVLRVLIQRLLQKQPVYIGDSEHLHFRLLQSGLSQRQAVLLFYGIAFSFGITTLFLQSSQKLIALSFLFILMLFVGIFLSQNGKK